MYWETNYQRLENKKDENDAKTNKSKQRSFKILLVNLRPLPLYKTIKNENRTRAGV